MTASNNPEMFNRKDTIVLRGVAILFVILHNYTHFVDGIVLENEFSFSIKNVDVMLSSLLHPDANVFAHIFSYIGIYAFPVFVFLSAYGLVVKYEKKEHEVPVLSYIWNHWRKLFSFILIGFSGFILFDAITPNHIEFKFINILVQLSLFGNLYIAPGHVFFPGPYWCFGLFFQLYLFYRFVVYRGQYSLLGKCSVRTSNLILCIIGLLSVILQIMFPPEGDIMIWYKYNFGGHILPFTLGVILARADGQKTWYCKCFRLLICNKNAWLRLVVFITFSILLFVSTLNFYTWLLSPLIACFAVFALANVLGKFVYSVFSVIGLLSPAILISHPIARKIFLPYAYSAGIYTGLLMYCLACLFLGILFDVIIKYFKSYSDKEK